MTSRTSKRVMAAALLFVIAGVSAALVARESCSDWNQKSFFDTAGALATRLCIATGDDPNAIDEGGYTPLHRIVWIGDEGIVRVLLDNGASPNLQDQEGKTPLHWAVARRNRGPIQLLLGSGADPNLRDTEGATALQYIVYPNLQGDYVNTSFQVDADIAQSMLDAGADPNIVPEDGIPLLHWAVRVAQDPASIAVLARGGAHLDQLDGKYNASPLHWAVARGDPEITRALLEAGADANLRDGDGGTPLHWAVRQEHRQMLLWIWERRLDWNVDNADYEIVDMLLGEGAADPDAQDARLESPLHWLVRGAQLPAHEVYSANASIESQRQVHEDALLTEDLEKMEMLFEAGATLDLGNNYGDTPLHLALWRGASAKASALLEAGADPNAGNGSGFTALHIAAGKAIRGEGLAPVLELLEAGANAELRDGEGRTPMAMALDGYRFGAGGNRRALMKALANAGANVNLRDDVGYSPLHWAFEAKDVDLAIALIDAGADIFLASKSSSTFFPANSALYMAVCRDWAGDVLEAILKRKLDPYVADTSGRTGLDIAEECNRPDVAERMLGSG